LVRPPIPKLSNVAFLQDDVTFSALPQMRTRGDRAAADAAQSLGIELRTVIVHRAEELPSAFRSMRKNHDQAVMVSSSAFMFVHRKVLADLAAEHRIPVMYEVQHFLESGGVMSYGVNVAEMQRRPAGYVGKLRRDANPAELH